MYSISREALFLGQPYKMGNICKIYQLTFDDIYNVDTGITSQKYAYYLGLLTMEQHDLDSLKKKKKIDIPDEITIFQYLLISALYDKTFFLELKQAFSTFIREEVLISCEHGMVIIGDPLEKRIINDDNFLEFQYGLRATNKMRVVEPPPENETPMQRKFRLKREERERVKERKANKDNSVEIELADIMSSVVTMGSISLTELPKTTLYQAKVLLERGQLQEGYHTELDMLMAGADSKKIKPKYWIRKI